MSFPPNLILEWWQNEQRKRVTQCCLTAVFLGWSTVAIFSTVSFQSSTTASAFKYNFKTSKRQTVCYSLNLYLYVTFFQVLFSCYDWNTASSKFKASSIRVSLQLISKQSDWSRDRTQPLNDLWKSIVHQIQNVFFIFYFIVFYFLWIVP